MEAQDYDVMQSDSLEQLMMDVQIVIRGGWQPQGGVCVVIWEEQASLDIRETQRMYYQAVILPK